MINYITSPFKWFFKLEAASGLLLLISAVIALIVSNSSFSSTYFEILQSNFFIGVKNIVIGVPSNQFGSQEPGTNEEIKKFCEVNFNVNFPMTDKVEVKGENAHPIYLWAKENFGKSAVPKWNFHKILINIDGKIQETYSSLTSPTSKKITNEIEKILNIK